jgi:hypothetical protein
VGKMWFYGPNPDLGEPRLTQQANQNLGEDNIIFVGSSIDIWAEEKILGGWIRVVLKHCKDFPNNQYFFQTKNPQRMYDYKDDLYDMNEKGMLYDIGITAETNRDTSKFSKAPPVSKRLEWLRKFDCPKMISIEPIVDFDTGIFPNMITGMGLDFISIGADSKKCMEECKIQEPDSDKTMYLIEELGREYDLRLKENLHRILGITKNEMHKLMEKYSRSSLP